MSIRVETADGFLLDSWETTMCAVDPSGRNYALKTDFFDITSPFLMNSQFESQLKTSENGSASQVLKKKKRKRKLDKNEGEIQADLFHNQIRPHIIRAYGSLTSTTIALDNSYFLSGSQPADNNLQSRTAACIHGTSCDFVALCQEALTSGLTVVSKKIIQSGSQHRMQEAVNTVWETKGDNAVTAMFGQDTFIFPCHSRFLMSDILQLSPAVHDVFSLKGNGLYVSELGEFDLLVLDPPWQSKSVKRLKQYGSLGHADLLTLPLQPLMAPGCIVVVWVTNRQAHRRFILEQLFPTHHIQHLATWYWLKVTRTGECVRDVDDPHKKPYEVLLIGRYGNKPSNPAEPSQPTTSEEQCLLHKSTSTKPKSEGLSTCTSFCEKCDQTPQHKCDGCNSQTCHQSDSTLKPMCEGCYSSSCNKSDTSPNIVCRACNTLPCSTSDRTPPHKCEGCNTPSCDCSNSVNWGDSRFPDHKVIMSIPCSLHSKKPPLSEVLGGHMPGSPRCLELFARNLQPHWTSWGNEVLVHQHTDFYQEVHKDVKPS